jgi:hypothetical protein
MINIIIKVDIFNMKVVFINENINYICYLFPVLLSILLIISKTNRIK